MKTKVFLILAAIGIGCAIYFTHPMGQLGDLISITPTPYTIFGGGSFGGACGTW